MDRMIGIIEGVVKVLIGALIAYGATVLLFIVLSFMIALMEVYMS